MAIEKVVYIVTADEAFHDESVEFTLVEARKLKRKLQKLEEDDASDDMPPGIVEIYKLERVS